jgi:hypothetical protein
MMNSTRSPAFLLVLFAYLAVATRPAPAQLFHHGQTQTTKIVTRNSGHSTLPVGNAAAAQYVVVPAGTTNYQSVVNLAGVQPAALVRSVPTLQMSVPTTQVAGTVQIAAGSGTDASDRQILALGFQLFPALGDRSSKVGNLEDLLNQKIASLFPTIGNGNTEDDIINLLMGFAESYLKSNSFGFVIDDVFEPILQRFISRLVAKYKTNNPPPNTPIVKPNGPSVITVANGTITITGTLTAGTYTLTPTTAPVVQPTTTTLPNTLPTPDNTLPAAPPPR